MTQNLELAHVTECNVSGCGYNHDGCHASAITVGGHGVSAKCATFIPLGTKGGLDRVATTVGACQRGDCTHNVSLECAADTIRVGAASESNVAGCLTYEVRSA
ncbi:DUF1540 domain-containing protein [Jonesia quinghaiensis]|uniref:DUF1540 domain-containing protein n=1 Tax=Jonesia quinghaiensis TaxID=262806 RepID=UPI00040C483A|nr:DUF1540 domain-containing protein [Jonesia quinghaiensis]